MLSERGIEIALREGNISITLPYFQDLNGSDCFTQDERWVDIDAASAPSAFLRHQIVGSRIGLTLGPLLKRIGKASAINDAARYERSTSIIDLRKLPEGYGLHPGEGVAAFSNERIRFSHRVSALIVARVTNDANGINVNTSYVNTSWDGLVKLRIKNESDKIVFVRRGMQIAGLFVFDNEDQESQLELKDRGPHFGYCWGKIYEQHIDPFVEVPYAPAPLRPSIKQRIEDTWNEWGVVMVQGLFFVTVSGGLLAFLPQFGKVDDLASRLRDVDGRLERLSANAASLPLSGAEELWLDKGKTSVTREIQVRDDISDNAFIFTRLEFDNSTMQAGNLQTFGRIIGSRGRRIFRLEIRRDGGETLPAGVVRIRWAIIPG